MASNPALGSAEQQAGKERLTPAREAYAAVSLNAADAPAHLAAGYLMAYHLTSAPAVFLSMGVLIRP